MSLGGVPPQYVGSRAGQLSVQLSVGWEMSTGQSSMMCCGEASGLWVAGKTVIHH